jgi:divalent metal cation (Fe/Co/Zn/Cd) transporter
MHSRCKSYSASGRKIDQKIRKFNARIKELNARLTKETEARITAQQELNSRLSILEMGEIANHLKKSFQDESVKFKDISEIENCEKGQQKKNKNEL